MLTVVTGPPCSGKTTHVREHAQPGDVVIDFDDFAQALGSPVRHGHDQHIAQVAAAARIAAIREAVCCHQQGARVWIVDGAPSDYRQVLYFQAAARFVRLSANPAELHRRADAERPARWHGLIDEWLRTGGRAQPEMRLLSKRRRARRLGHDAAADG